MLDIDSFLKFKSVSEEKWRNASIKGTIWAFNPGADPLESRPNR
jgi:hypothetical protein